MQSRSLQRPVIKGKLFFVQFPERPTSTEVVIAEETNEKSVKNPTGKTTPGKAVSSKPKADTAKIVKKTPEPAKTVAKNDVNEIISSKEGKDNLQLKVAALNEALRNIADGTQEISDTSVTRIYTEAKQALDSAQEKGKVDTSQYKTPFASYAAIKNGKRPGSKSLLVALKNNRIADLRFWINKKNVVDYKIDEVPILLHALENNYSSAVIRYLVETADNNEKFVNPVNYTFQPPYENYYLTPLTKACINGDTTIINILLDAKARFYPEGLNEEHAVDQAKFLWNQFGWNKDVRLLISRRMPAFPNPEMDKANAVKKIISDMVLVEGGTFQMGCKGDRADCGNRYPLVDMTVKSFYISKYELTQQLWETVMEVNPSLNATCSECAAENISWSDIEQFLQKINNLSDKKFRLPTEPEWEYAAKGGMKSQGYKFAGSNTADNVAWTKLNSAKSQPVAQKQANELGLYDMSGNIQEWCTSYYSENLEIYKTSPEGAKFGSERILRGGSYNTSETACDVTSRYAFNINNKSPQVGFRLVFDAN